MCRTDGQTDRRTDGIAVASTALANGWMDHIKLGMQIGLGHDHIVLDGDPDPLSQRGTADRPPVFGPYLLWPNGWMD